MSNAPAILRSFIIYLVCVPVAVFIGYLLANPLDYPTMAIYAIFAGLLCFPLLLRWHNWMLLFSWNLSMNLFFLKGSPPPWMVMMALSLGISILQRALSQQSQFIRVREITLPLIFLAIVVMGTAKLTGGFGLRMLGSEVYGGKKYLYIIGGILGYFALTALRIPPRRKGLALGLFFLGGALAVIGELYGILPSGFNGLFWFFTPDPYSATGGIYGEHEVIRFASAAGFSTAVTSFMLANYGFQGIFLARKPWRSVIFVLGALSGLMGGFRSFAGGLAMILVIQFFLEGMHRTKLLPIFAMIGLAMTALIIPLTPKLPWTVQRALAFLPLPIDREAQMDAEGSWVWRYEMWKELLPEIPRHLLLGKGYGFTADQYQFMGRDSAFHPKDSLQGGLGLSSDYHNGWLSVLIIFGLWGMIVFLWFAVAGIYVLYCNFRYGDPLFRTANAFLLAAFVTRFLLFMSVSGTGLHMDLPALVGWLGLGVSLNGGVCRRPALQPVAFQKRALINPVPRHLPVFQR
jgi:hypothetical protein